MTLFVMSLSWCLLLLSASAATVAAAAGCDVDSDSDSNCGTCHGHHADYVRHLPGWDAPLPSAWCSGYLTYPLVNPKDDSVVTVNTHYILVTAEDDTDNEKPLLYWSNGGPGASSLFGLLTELGPLLLSDQSVGVDGSISFWYNRNTWSRLGHVLLFDQPAPVGFSYCNNDNTTAATSNNSCANISWTDELASLNSFSALQTFYDKFPTYLQKPLFLTGESYAGIYIPTLARRILDHNTQQQQREREHVKDGGSDNAVIPLKGFAVGDGCLGTRTGICGNIDQPDAVDVFQVLFLAGHGQIPFDTFENFLLACRPYHPTTATATASETAPSQECQEVLKKVQEQVGGFYEYSLYDDCTYRNGLAFSSPASRNRRILQRKRRKTVTATAASGEQEPMEKVQNGGALNDYDCGGDVVMEQWLKLSSVKQALHVTSEYFAVDNAVGFDYTPTEPDLRPFYKHVIHTTNISVLIYNGDADPSITMFATENWTSHLQLDRTRDWRPWTIDGCRRMGGYVTQYANGQFDFVTIRGAGHMVPTYKSDATFAFLKAWMEGKDYPAFDKDCLAPSTTTMMTMDGERTTTTDTVATKVAVDMDVPVVAAVKDQSHLDTSTSSTTATTTVSGQLLPPSSHLRVDAKRVN